ncbi:MAG TPA: NAD(P)-dependent alcohol dehydrogenase [Terracidiphilus sp.]|nr:NAD(P)-dependent alcohol dehydrogenase [Terracidiphilus sp.]
MHLWQIPSFGVDALEFIERPAPAPAAGEVLVRVRAVSFNFRDLMMVKGLYNPKLRLPRIPCSDGAGQVQAVGEGVAAWKPGDRVAGIFMQNWLSGPPTPDGVKGALGGDADGMLAEYVVLRASGLVSVPERMSFLEASTLPCAAVTAWNALKAGQVRAGSTVLVQGTGGVSLFAIQFARALGARVLGTSTHAEKLERALALGLDAGLNTAQTPEWAAWVLDQTGGAGVDLVVEVGGGQTLPHSLRAVRMGGVVAQIGVLSGAACQLPIATILHKQVRIQGIYVGSRADFEEMNAFLAQNLLEPVVEGFPWAESREVLGRMEAQSHFGKLAVNVE